MIINIQATLTEEQAIVLATEKGYQTTIDGQQNPETPSEFVKRVYESMVINDAIKHFIAFDERKTQAEREASAEIIRKSVFDSVTSSVV